MRKTWIAFGILTVALSIQALARDESIVPDIANADFGAYPLGYEALIRAWFETALKDPESARYMHFSKPRKEWAVAQKKPIYGWSVCATINAKNSYGGYTGAQVWWFSIQDGKVIRSQNTDEDRNILGLIIPGKRISLNHDVNCEDGDSVAASNQIEDK